MNFKSPNPKKNVCFRTFDRTPEADDRPRQTGSFDRSNERTDVSVEPRAESNRERFGACAWTRPETTTENRSRTALRRFSLDHPITTH